MYVITNTANGEQYIGSSVEPRQRYHKHVCRLKKRIHSTNIQRSCDTHGIESFTFKVLCQCPKEALLVLEQAYHDLLKPGYNSSNDVTRPSLGLKHTLEQRATWSADKKAAYESGLIKKVFGRRHSPEILLKIATSRAWYKPSKETIQKQVASRKANGLSVSPESIKAGAEKRMAYRLLSKDGVKIVLRTDEVFTFLGTNRSALKGAMYHNRPLKGYTITTCGKPDET